VGGVTAGRMTANLGRMLDQEGGRYRPPIEKFEETLQALTRLLHFGAFVNPPVLVRCLSRGTV
jgi:hypothetical protein